MLKPNIAGPKASAQKYDIITALGSNALSLDRADQRRVLRLITLITARYNWARNLLRVGQREIAKLWSCDERTVKREMAKFRGMGWLIVQRQGARGRVTEYRIDIERILLDTKPSWANVGTDFVSRLDGPQLDNGVVPFPGTATVLAPDVSDGTEWALAQAILYQEDQASFGSWIKALQRSERVGGHLKLCAPSKFHAAYVQTHLAVRILAACQSVDADITQVSLFS